MNGKICLIFGFTRECCKSERIDILPDDIIKLFVEWTSLSDCFHVEISDESIDIKTLISYQTIQRTTEMWNGKNHYSTAIGTDIICKGMKQIWKFKILAKKKNDRPTIMVGIIDNNVAKSLEYIGTFWEGCSKGYGLSFYSGKKFGPSCKLTSIQEQDLYKIEKFTMILDLTQKNSEYGILYYQIDDSKLIAFDAIDIDKEYRCAVALYLNMHDVVALLPRFSD
eukprot:185241_1